MPESPIIRWADVRGHEPTRALLRAAVSDDRLPHAWLFAGPDGIGKRSVATVLAAWLQCEAHGADACGVCSSCRQIAAASHPDVLFVAVAQGKKEIGVDRAREVKRFTQLQPVRGRAKIVIIDDAQMLTVAAQNALLKTLEEPPDRSLLIVVANNPDALLPTVRSRCQRIQFVPLPTDAVVEVLTARGLDAPAARELAIVADGSPGRALALGDSLRGERRAQLLQALAALGSARYVAVMQAAHELNHPEGDLAGKLEVLLAHYRDAAVEMVQTGASPHALRPILRQADVVHETWDAVRRGNPNRQLLVESLVLRLARAA